MSEHVKKHRYTISDHLTAYLVLLVIVCLMVLGVFVLYLSGIFDPVDVGPALVDTQPIELPTPPTRTSLMDLLIPGALAEEAPQAEEPTEEAPSSAPADGEPAGAEGLDLEQLLQEIVEQEADADDAEIPTSAHVTVDKGDLAINENLPDHIYNLLLLATDSRDIDASRGRSDVMIIASVNRTTNEVKLTSLSRDLYVPVPNGVGNQKINTAYAFGGPQLALKTVNQLFELNMEDYALVNFASMAAIVDALGGVDIYLEPEEYIYINENVAVSEDFEGFAKSDTRKKLGEADQETIVHLDGLQSVAYARIRKLDSDLYRGSRQRILLQSIMERAMKNLSASTFYSLATSLMSSINTNVTLMQVLDVGKWVLEADEVTMQELSIPVPDSWHYAREKDSEVISFNLKTNVQALHTFMFGEYIPAKADGQ